MAFQQSGIQLVAKGFSRFISQIGQVNRAYNSMSRASSNLSRAVANNSRRLVEAQSRYSNAVLRSRNATDRAWIALIRIQRAQRDLAAAQRKNAKAQRELTLASTHYQNVLDDEESSSNAVVRAEFALEAARERAAEASRQEANASDKAQEARRAEFSADNALAIAKEQVRMAAWRLAKEQAKNLGLSQHLQVVTAAVATTFQVLGVAVAAANIAFGLFRTAVNAVIKVANLLWRTLKGLIGMLERVTRPMRQFLTDVLSTAAGIGLYDVFRQLNMAMRNMIENLIESLSYFQRLDIQLEALAARDLNRDMGVPMSRAFQVINDEAQELLDWIRRIAVTTPFSVENLSQTVAMANAMGLNIEMAKRLTVAVGNFTAAMGLTEDHMFRIIYNFGQMLAQGKLNGREFRDLANSFVPVWDMMKRMGEQAGMTAQEFKELAFSGGIPVQAFFEEFIQMANEGFPGAMEKMARTAQGVTNNIKDFIDTVIGIEVLGPTFDRFTSIAADALDKLLQPEVQHTANLLGNILVKSVDYAIAAFNRMWDAAGTLARALGFTGFSIDTLGKAIASMGVFASRVFDRIGVYLTNTADRLNKTASQYASQAARWGYNIVAFFAKGMAAAAKLIVRVITQIGAILRYWLSPGSPPRIAPDLPKWGMAAMREWLSGFTMVDFDILEGIQDPLKEALDILEQTGRIGENQAGRIFANLSKELAKAIETGSGLNQVLTKIEKQAGPWGQDIAELAKRYFEWAEGVKALEAAELALEAAQSKEQRTRVDLSNKIREYNQLIREGVDRTVLNARLQSINAAESAARAATEERKEAEKNVEAWEDQVDRLDEAVKLQERLIQQLLDLTKEQIIEIDIQSGGSGISDLTDLFSDLPSLAADAMSEVEAGVQREMERFEKEWEEGWQQSMFAEAEKSVDEFIKGATDAFDDFFGGIDSDIKSLNESFAGLKDLLFPVDPGTLDPVMRQDLKRSRIQVVLDDLAVVGRKLAAIDWAKVADGLVNIVDNLISLAENKSIQALGEMLVDIADGLGNVVLGISALSDIAVGERPIFDIIRASLLPDDTSWSDWTETNVTGQIVGSFTDLASETESYIVDLVSALVTTLTNPTEAGKTWGDFFYDIFVQPIIDSANALFDALVRKSIIPEMMSEISTVMSDELTSIVEDWATSLGDMLDKAEEVFGVSAPGSIVTKVRDAVSTLTGLLGTKMELAAKGFRDKALPIFQDAFDELLDKLQDIIDKARRARDTLNSMPKTPGGLPKGTSDTTNGSSCFVAGTMVDTPAGPRKIEDIDLGDIVWSYNEQTGDVIPGKVVNTFENRKTTVVHLDTSSGNMTCTPHHRFLSSGKWVEAIDLKAGDEILMRNGENTFVLGIGVLTGYYTVHNFTVKNTHTYFVESHCVHNAKRAGGGIVYANTGYAVGERGWEWFVPRVTGWVTNQQQLLRIMRAGMAHAGGGAGGGSVTKIVNINMGGVTIENNMDMHTLQAIIRETVREEFA